MPRHCRARKMSSSTAAPGGGLMVLENPLHGMRGQLGRVLEFEFFLDVFAMGFDRLRDSVRDWVAICGVVKPWPIISKISISRSVSRSIGDARYRAATDGAMHHPLRHALAEVDLAGQDRADRLHDRPADLVLADIADGAGPQARSANSSSSCMLSTSNFMCRIALLELLDQGDAAAVLQSQVDDRHVRPRGLGEVLRFRDAAGLAADFQVRLVRNQADQALTHQRMIVNDQNPNGS